jgi:pyridoxine 4-dehydrogenase
MTATGISQSAPGGSASLAGRRVARIGYGVLQLARPGIDRERAHAVLRRAVERGVNHLDTAQFYGAGAANELIREALSPYPEDLVLVTKVGAEDDEHGKLVAAQRPEQLRASVDANLAALGVDRIDVVNLRRLDAPPGIQAAGDQLVDLDTQLAELIALRDEGKIGGIGLSGVDAEQLRRALPAGIACVQNWHNVLDRASEPVLDLCREHDVAWVPFCPLGSAFAGLEKVTDHPTVREVAASLGVTAAQVGLAWLLGQYAHTLLIPGTADVAHLDENIAAGAVHLDAGTMRLLGGLVAG